MTLVLRLNFKKSCNWFYLRVYLPEITLYKLKSIMELKSGDVVVLNSGGPDMVVGNKGLSDGCFYCLWFDGLYLREAEFPLACLKTAPTKDRTKADK
jgi:uncharacterized protein YodC (DUF2158 family)